LQVKAQTSQLGAKPGDTGIFLGTTASDFAAAMSGLGGPSIMGKREDI
jgi:hypothetical protein